MTTQGPSEADSPTPAYRKPFWLRFVTVAVIAALICSYTSIWVFGGLNFDLLARLFFLPAIGMVGAIIANTSGTGGGVVFVPVFNVLRHEGIFDLTREQIVAASFLIQCFGMTIGSLTWTNNIYSTPKPATGVSPRAFWGIVFGVCALSIPVMLLTQRLTDFEPAQVLVAFKLFSICLGLALIITTWTVNRALPERTVLARIDMIVLAVLALAGGFVTALFSVGVGEFIALYLFIRHYPLNTCTATAVIISALHVQTGAIYNIENELVPWEVVALAAPGALLGGFLARRIAHWLGSKRLKTLDGGWIVLSSVYLILLNI
jgi:uncharacterized membrane protein YfcA